MRVRSLLCNHLRNSEQLLQTLLVTNVFSVLLYIFYRIIFHSDKSLTSYVRDVRRNACGSLLSFHFKEI